MLVDIPNAAPRKNLHTVNGTTYKLYSWPIMHITETISMIISESFDPNLSYIFLYMRTPKINYSLPIKPPKLRLLVAKDS